MKHKKERSSTMQNPSSESENSEGSTTAPLKAATPQKRRKRPSPSAPPDASPVEAGVNKVNATAGPRRLSRGSKTSTRASSRSDSRASSVPRDAVTPSKSRNKLQVARTPSRGPGPGRNESPPGLSKPKSATGVARGRPYAEPQDRPQNAPQSNASRKSTGKSRGPSSVPSIADSSRASRASPQRSASTTPGGFPDNRATGSTHPRLALRDIPEQSGSSEQSVQSPFQKLGDPGQPVLPAGGLSRQPDVGDALPVSPVGRGRVSVASLRRMERECFSLKMKRLSRQFKERIILVPSGTYEDVEKEENWMRRLQKRYDDFDKRFFCKVVIAVLVIFVIYIIVFRRDLIADLAVIVRNFIHGGENVEKYKNKTKDDTPPSAKPSKAEDAKLCKPEQRPQDQESVNI